MGPAHKPLREARVGRAGRPDPLSAIWVYACLLGAGCLWVARRPRLSGPLAAGTAGALLLSPLVLTLGLIVIGGGGAAFMVTHPQMVRSAWRDGRTRRSYNRVWRDALEGAGLVKVRKLRPDAVPRLRGAEHGEWCDRLSVRMVHGQHTEAWEDAGPALAHSFKSRRVRVLDVEPGKLVLECATGDPLQRVVEALAVPDFDPGMDVVAFLQAVPVGMRDDGSEWRVQVIGRHILVAGAMGSGKGGFIWSVLSQLGPLIHEGLVEVWAADPKGGMELGLGKPLYARFETTLEGIATMLEQAADRMDERCDKFGLDGTRLHEPTREDPLVLVLIDEIANLTAYAPKAIRDRIELALGRLLSKGRAPAFVVLAALQDPRVEVLRMRGLFPERVCLKVDERQQVNMVLGDRAWERGARADLIKDAPGTEQGVGYVKRADRRGMDRVRGCRQTNENVREVAARFPCPKHSHGVLTDKATAVLEQLAHGPLTAEQRAARASEFNVEGVDE